MLTYSVLFLAFVAMATAAETGEYTCGATSMTLKISWLATDPAKALMYVKTFLNDVNCKAAFTTNALTASLTVTYGNCGTTQPSSTGGNEAVVVTIMATQLSSGAILNDKDTEYTITCDYINAAVQLVGSQSVNTGLTGDPATGTASLPEMTLSLHKASDDSLLTTAIPLGTLFYVQACIPDVGHASYAGNSIITTIEFSSDSTLGFPAENIIAGSCYTGAGGMTKQDPGCSEGAYANDVICAKSLQMYPVSYPQSTALTIKATLFLCPLVTDNRCNNKVGCPTARKRRAAGDYDETLFITGNKTIEILRHEQTHHQVQDTPPCVGYTSNTVFYAVVVVLAVLLVITIGLAAFFGSRARAVVLAGKDNPVYAH